MIVKMSERDVKRMRIAIHTALAAYKIKVLILDLEDKKPSNKTLAIIHIHEVIESELNEPNPNAMRVKLLLHDIETIMAQPEQPFVPGPDAEVVTVNMKRNQ